MKINITLGGAGYKAGYVNIDPTLKRLGEDVVLENANDDQTNIIKADVRNLDEVSLDNECLELVAEDILDYLQINEARSVLAHWISKLRHGGKIIVGGTDIAEVCRMFYKRAIDLESLNEILHGSFQEAWSVKLSHTTMEDLISFLESQGIKVTKKRIQGFKMIVEGERP
jgi:predicted SAM-dependent methyltransferase